jgi:hypothetical protein
MSLAGWQIKVYMFLDKDLPIIGRKNNIQYGDISLKMFKIIGMELEKLCKPWKWPWESEILDAKGIPYSNSKNTTGKITIRRYNKFKKGR